MEVQDEAIKQLGSAVSPDTVVHIYQDVREILETIVEFHNGDVASAIDWTTSPNSALENKSPAELIRAGESRKLTEFWNACSELYGQ